MNPKLVEEMLKPHDEEIEELKRQKDALMEELTDVLRGGRQCDEEGVEIIMSRQACLEAADEIESLREECREAWKEAAIGWTVCGSVHEQWAKGKDALYTTRHGDFERHAEEARQRHHLLTHNARSEARPACVTSRSTEELDGM